MNKDFIALDVETATKEPCSICEMGIVLVNDLEIVKKQRFLIQPPRNEYHYLNTQIHGIGMENTKNAPSFPKIWKIFGSDLCKNLIVAHNASFDLNCLQNALDYYKINYPKFSYDCTYILTGQRLDILAAAYKFKLEHHHALSDAIACAQIYINLQKGLNPDFSHVNPELMVKKSVFESFGLKNINHEDLQPDFEHADKNSPLYMKKVVFTGDMESLERQDAAHTAKELGAKVNTSISRKTDYIITGHNPGPSKMQKVEELKAEGYPIKILNERQFIALVKEFS